MTTDVVLLIGTLFSHSTAVVGFIPRDFFTLLWSLKQNRQDIRANIGSSRSNLSLHIIKRYVRWLQSIVKIRNAYKGESTKGGQCPSSQYTRWLFAAVILGLNNVSLENKRWANVPVLPFTSTVKCQNCVVVYWYLHTALIVVMLCYALTNALCILSSAMAALGLSTPATQKCQLKSSSEQVRVMPSFCNHKRLEWYMGWTASFHSEFH